jgi:signal transduction histidine kinase/phage shock protein PspC (stress-responsive transcriptional regulator)
VAETSATSSTPESLPGPPRERWRAGVCRDLSGRLGVPLWSLRLSFVVYTLVYGLGPAVYAALWLVRALRPPSAAQAAPAARPGLRRVVAALPYLGLALLSGLDGDSLADQWRIWRYALPTIAVAAALAVFWPSAAGRDRLRRLRDAARRAPGADAGRAAAGTVVALSGLIRLLTIGTSLSATGSVLLAALVVLVGAGLAVLPLLLRVQGQLRDERTARLRAQERAEVAALMHDSVLQTLALIQHSEADPARMARMARSQERELRAWLYGPRTRPADGGPLSFARALEAAAAETEDRYGARIEVVAVGDAPLDEELIACVGSAREAMANAARYAGPERISVFAQVSADGPDPRAVRVYVRDRGVGFDPAAVPADRMGLRESIIGRMQRHGGEATVRTAPGEGTEIRLELPAPPPPRSAESG